MKKLLFLCAVFIAFFLNAQEKYPDTITIVLPITPEQILYKEFNNDNCSGKSISEDNVIIGEPLFLITHIQKCDDKYLVGGNYFGKHYYIAYNKENNKELLGPDKKWISIENAYNYYKEIPDKNLETLYNRAHELSQEHKRMFNEKTLKKLYDLEKNSIAILNAQAVSDDPFTGAEFKILNTSKKTIKYITFNFVGKNAVKDKVFYRKGVFNVSRKGIGPIEQYEKGTYVFDSVWLTDIVQYLSLISVNIQYMDGTSKLLPIKSLHYVDEDSFTFLE